jgi:thioglycine synthase
MRLESKRKYTTTYGDVLTRIKPSEDTIAELVPICKNNAITRISDITYMDKLYIPNFSAVVPGTEDFIWVYSGKGLTKADAKASALMEAIERYSSLPKTFSKPLIRGTYTELSRSYSVLHPDEVVEFVNPAYDEHKSTADFLQGFDLLNNESVLVPARLALNSYRAKLPLIEVFPHSHTNGLASGNVLEEAVYHALCEVIERDASSIADLCASSIPYSILEDITNSLRRSENGGFLINRIPAEDRFVDDSNIFPQVDISQIVKDSKPINRLVKRFTDADITLLIKDITQKDIDIPTFVASSIEWITQDYGYFAKGYGTHLDSNTALIRAITEMSQTRAVNIQGARDDLKKIQYKDGDEIYKRKWAFMDSTSRSNNQAKNIIMFQEIKSMVNHDILDDINLILTRLKSCGIKRVIIVDLTNPRIGIPVVRAIVPGLETFEVTGLIMGTRAKHYFRRINHLSKDKFNEE